MAKSELPLYVIKGYWIAVRKLLRSQYNYKLHEAVKSVQSYQTALKRLKVGDMIYHAPIEQTARGIVQGEY